MKVEFLVNTALGDGRQIFISASEFIKAEKNEDEYNSFAFATEAFFSMYGSESFFVDRDHYDVIRQNLDKAGAVIITAYKEREYSRNVNVEVFVSNNNQPRRVDFSSIE